jgi:hypothetical protein
MVPSERTSKSPIGTLGDIGRERDPQDGSHRLKLTNRWERDGGPTVRLTERSGGEQR